MSVVHANLRTPASAERSLLAAAETDGTAPDPTPGAAPALTLKVRKLDPAAHLPEYAHPGDAALDLFANELVELAPGAWHLVRTGIAIALPPGTEGQVRPRSGLAARHGITLLNAPGTIDEGYRGEVGVIVINHGRAPFAIEPGTKIAQLVVAPVMRVRVEEAAALSETARGTGGFGSTGYRKHAKGKHA